MGDTSTAFSISVTSGANPNVRSRRLVLAKNRDFAGKMAQVYPGDQLKVSPAGVFEGLSLQLKGLRAPSGRDIRAFYTEIRTSLKADPSLAGAFRSILPTLEHPILAAATLNAVETVNKSLGSDKMLDAFQKVLPPEHIERLRAALVSGGIEQVVDQLAHASEKGVKIKSKLMQALFMPVITIVGAIASAIFIAMTQLPAMAQMFASSKAPLPLPTKMMLSCVEVLKAYPILAVVLALSPILLIFILPQIYQSSRGFQDFVDKLPVVGKLIIRLRWVKTLRTLAMLLDSNMPYEKALNFTIRSVDHIRTKHFLTGVKETIVLKAVDLYMAARANEDRLGGIDTRWIGLLPLGAKTGSTGTVLNTIASDYEERAEEMLETLPKFLELVALIFAAAIVTFVMAASILPSFRLISVFK